MALLLTTLIIITCILLTLIVLVQNPKGGGLSSSFGGGGTQLFGGVKKTTDFLDRGTWALAIVLVVLVMAANIVVTPGSSEGELPESATENVDIATPAAPQGQNFELPAGVSGQPQPGTSEEETE